MNVLDEINIEWEDSAAVCVVMASGGYPVSYKKGYEISGLDNVGDLTVFHAGTAVKDGKIVTNGGRVLGVTAVAKTLTRLLKMLMQVLQKFLGQMNSNRSDIGIKKY